MKSPTLGSTLGLAVALLATSVAVPTSAADAAKSAATKPDTNACIFVRNLYDWRQLDPTTLVVWGPGRREAYLMKLSFPLQNLSEWSLAFVDHNHDGNLCGYGMDAVVSPDRLFPQRSTISGITRLDKTDMLGLEERYKVKLLPKPKTPAKADEAGEKSAA